MAERANKQHDAVCYLSKTGTWVCNTCSSHANNLNWMAAGTRTFKDFPKIIIALAENHSETKEMGCQIPCTWLILGNNTDRPNITNYSTYFSDLGFCETFIERRCGNQNKLILTWLDVWATFSSLQRPNCTTKLYNRSFNLAQRSWSCW